MSHLRDGEAWWAAVYGVVQSWTQLKQLSSSSSSTWQAPSLHKHSWLTHHPWVEIKLKLQPLYLPGILRSGAKSSNPIITKLVSLANIPQPLGLSKSLLININPGVIKRGLLWITKDTYFTFFFFFASGAISRTGNKTKYSCSSCIGNYQGFRSYVPGIMKTKYIVLIIKLCITDSIKNKEILL